VSRPPNRGRVRSRIDRLEPEDEEPTAAEIAREEGTPPRLGVVIAGIAGFVAAVAIGAVPVALPAGLLGLVAIVGGALRRTTGLVTFGFVALFAGVILSGLGGASPEPLLVGTAGAFLAWDAAIQTIDLGGALKQRPDGATRPLLVHVAISAGLTSAAAGGGYAVFRIAAGGRPIASLVFLLVGVLAILAALRV